MSTWKGKTRGGLLGYQIFVLTFKFLGLNATYILLRFVALYYFLFAWKSNKYIYKYFREIQGYGKIKSFFRIYSNYFIFGQVLIDKVAGMAGYNHKFSYDFEGEEYLRQMKEGGLLISAHIGNWEIAGNLLQRLDTPFNIVMFDEEHQKIKNLLDEVMKEKQVKIIVLKDDLSHIIEIKNALKNQELIAIHGDRFVEGSKTIEMEFMGKKALFPEGPFYLAAKFKAPVSYVFAMKESKFHYHFYATPSKVYDTPPRKINEEILKPLLKDYINAFEKALKRHPNEWFNYYKFWKD